MKILFVCSGNTCRSPMAQGLFLQQLNQRKVQPGNDFIVLSAGIMAYPGALASNETIEVMRGYSIDLSKHRSQQLSPELIHEADLIFTMTSDQCSLLHKKYPHKCTSIFLISDYAGMGNKNVNDPFGMTREEYSRTAKQLQSMVEKIIDKLL